MKIKEQEGEMFGHFAQQPKKSKKNKMSCQSPTPTLRTGVSLPDSELSQRRVRVLNDDRTLLKPV